MPTPEQRAAKKRIAELEADPKHSGPDKVADEQTRTSPVGGPHDRETPKEKGWQKRRGTKGEEVWIDPHAEEEQ